MTRRMLFASLILAPLTVVLHFVFRLGGTTDFVLAAASLIPLAWLIGEATEHAAHHTGAGVGGFLNATFGNAPELIIALFAVNSALYEVVRGSLTGSVVGNLLLVLGFSLRRHHQLHIADEPSEMRAWSLPMSLAVLGVATVVTALIAEILVGSVDAF